VRIIAGQWRGRTIKAPRDNRVRPTGDRAREAWMSIVQPEIPGARVLDLYAGSGALGLEALSRGAESADFVDVATAAITAIRENGSTLGALERMRIHRAESLRFVQKLDAGRALAPFAVRQHPRDRARHARRASGRWRDEELWRDGGDDLQGLT
jgi:16S rRNA (guanine966-N2)-methyltransferase